jgi:hypothetical protein
MSDCFKQSGQKIELEIHNDILENQIKILIPIIEKVCLEYIEKRFPTQTKISVPDKDENREAEGS